MSQKPIPFTPSNKVEQLQAEAATSIEKRAEFWEELLNSEVYVLSEEIDGEEMLLTWQGAGEDACGVFTSEEKIIGAMPPDTPYIIINARVIFESMANEGLGTFINPRYEPSVRVKSEEIKSMLNGNYHEVIGRNT